MQPKFWQSRWQQGKTGFHQPEVNPKLAKYSSSLKLTKGNRIFVPLCGKSKDIGWLARQGYDVIGVELVESAVKQLFAELEVTPSIVQYRNISHYQAKYAEQIIDIWAGNILDLTTAEVGHIDAIYDRAALVALPDTPPDYLRSRYVRQLLELSHCAPQLLITFIFDQDKRAGPPFVITPEQIEGYYGQHYQLTLLEDMQCEAVLSDGTPGRSMVWLLSNEA